MSCWIYSITLSGIPSEALQPGCSSSVDLRYSLFFTVSNDGTELMTSTPTYFVF